MIVARFDGRIRMVDGILMLELGMIVLMACATVALLAVARLLTVWFGNR